MPRACRQRHNVQVSRVDTSHSITSDEVGFEEEEEEEEEEAGSICLLMLVAGGLTKRCPGTQLVQVHSTS